MTSEKGVERPDVLGSQLNATEKDVLEAQELAASMSLERVRTLMKNVLSIHDGDPNFPHANLQKIKNFIGNDEVMDKPDKYKQLVEEMKLEAALITSNSPYAEVRAVTDNYDDPSTPVSTVRAWTIGIAFSCLLAFVNQLFSIRQPPIQFDTNIAQLLAYPVGKAWEKWMPRVEVGIPWSSQVVKLNPGRFNKKEHMLIAIMANTSKTMPFTQWMIWTQVLPHYFNQQYARSFWYIFLNAFATNFVGYGLAGLARRFLVYPSYCVWPKSLVTIALNAALHDEKNRPVKGPWGKIWNMSRYRFFMVSFGAMFLYFWLPNYLFQVLTFFSWMTWIAPDNVHLNVLTGMQNGLGLFNPLSTFDWNIVNFKENDPLMIPSFVTFNFAGGMFVTGMLILGIWYSNTWNTAYLPINSNQIFDHFGSLYNVSQALDARGMFDSEKYQKYSAPYMGAANCVIYGCYFAIYAAVVTHVLVFHRYELKMGFRGLMKGFRWRRDGKKMVAGAENQQESRAAEGEYLDVHNRLMAAYPEVSGWFYLATLVISVVCGVLGIVLWPTYTSPAVVLYGIWLCLMFVIPVGIVNATTGLEVTMNVLAEFIGGAVVQGNALAMNFFKNYGYMTCSHALAFANDLKIAHYVKIPPLVTFAGQLLATLISTVISSGVIKFQMDIHDVCTANPPMRFKCPLTNAYFTASVLWGTIGPTRVFGIHGQYKWLLLGFPLGLVLVLALYGLKRLMPDSRALRQIHVVAALGGALQWCPYNFSYAFPAVPIAWMSWIHVRGRYLDLWSKYNFVLSASLSAGVALSAIVMLFTVQWVGAEVRWWGNSQTTVGCEGQPCTLMTLAKGERFYPWWNPAEVPAT